MQARFEAAYHEAEQYYWLPRARRKLVLRLLKKLATPGARILDIGCSGGLLLTELNQCGFTNVIGIDKSKKAVELCTHRGLNVYQMDGSSPGFASSSFEFIIAACVLEHIRDDLQALRNWHGLLKPAGRLILIVPAFQALYSSLDRASGHFRRYSKAEAIFKLLAAGFKVTRFSYLNTVSLPFMVLRKVLNSRGDFIKLPRSLNSILYYALTLENRLNPRLPGASMLFIAAATNKYH